MVGAEKQSVAVQFLQEVAATYTSAPKQGTSNLFISFVFLVSFQIPEQPL